MCLKAERAAGQAGGSCLLRLLNKQTVWLQGSCLEDIACSICWTSSKTRRRAPIQGSKADEENRAAEQAECYTATTPRWPLILMMVRGSSLRPLFTSYSRGSSLYIRCLVGENLLRRRCWYHVSNTPSNDESSHTWLWYHIEKGQEEQGSLHNTQAQVIWKNLWKIQEKNHRRKHTSLGSH